MMIGIGNVQCHEWVDERRTNDALSIEDWVDMEQELKEIDSIK